MIEVKHLTKKYGTHLAVDDLSFTIEKGRIYGFLGPNGAGKSTTMNIMTGYIGASSERLSSMVTIFWKNLRKQKNVSDIFQRSHLYILI